MTHRRRHDSSSPDDDSPSDICDERPYIHTVMINEAKCSSSRPISRGRIKAPGDEAPQAPRSIAVAARIEAPKAPWEMGCEEGVSPSRAGI